jgi:hypothetical protein
MNFETEYSQTIAQFTRYVAEMPRHTYLAPGDSAGEMVNRMKAYAKVECLSLPAIHILTHEESWSLYADMIGGADKARQILKPFVEGKKPKRIFFLEDYYWDGEKINDIISKQVVNHLIVSHFTVMVGSERKSPLLPLPNTTTFTENADLAYVLYHTYNRRK